MDKSSVIEAVSVSSYFVIRREGITLLDWNQPKKADDITPANPYFPFATWEITYSRYRHIEVLLSYERPMLVDDRTTLAAAHCTSQLVESHTRLRISKKESGILTCKTRFKGDLQWHSFNKNPQAVTS